MTAMKHFWLVAILVGPLAHAAAPKKPAAAIGNAKEDEQSCPAPVSEASADVTLLRALGFAF